MCFIICKNKNKKTQKINRLFEKTFWRRKSATDRFSRYIHTVQSDGTNSSDVDWSRTVTLQRMRFVDVFRKVFTQFSLGFQALTAKLCVPATHCPQKCTQWHERTRGTNCNEKIFHTKNFNMVLETISRIIKVQLPAYLKRLPLPETIGGFARLTGNKEAARCTDGPAKMTSALLRLLFCVQSFVPPGSSVTQSPDVVLLTVLLRAFIVVFCFPGSLTRSWWPNYPVSCTGDPDWKVFPGCELESVWCYFAPSAGFTVNISVCGGVSKLFLFSEFKRLIKSLPAPSAQALDHWDWTMLFWEPVKVLFNSTFCHQRPLWSLNVV